MDVRRILTINYRLNVMGLIAGFFLIYIAISDKPWWILIGGSVEEHVFSAELSPFMTMITVLGRPVHLPIITYLNMGVRLSFLVAAATTILGSIFVRRSWSKKFISLAGLKTPIAFLILLFVCLEIVKIHFGITIPIIGRSTLTHKIFLTGGEITVHIPMTAKITQEYWTALIIGIPSLIAKLITSSKRSSQSNTRHHLT